MMLYTKPEARNVSQRLRGGPSYGQATCTKKKLVKIVLEIPEISSRTDRQTQTDIHTDVLITILHNRSRRQSNNHKLTSTVFLFFEYRVQLQFTSIVSN